VLAAAEVEEAVAGCKFTTLSNSCFKANLFVGDEDEMAAAAEAAAAAGGLEDERSYTTSSLHLFHS